MELIKDYDLAIHYHSGKVNVVVDTLIKSKRITSCIDNLTTKVIEGVKKNAIESPNKGTWGYIRPSKLS